MTYEFLLSDGGPLVDVLPLESDGYGAQSVPRAVLDVDFDTNSFVIADDLSARFVAGFVFDIIAGPFLSTYTVDVGGAVYDGPTNTTSIPVTTTIVAQPFGIVDVIPGPGGPGTEWVINGASNGDCVYYPGSSFTVAGNSDGPSNGVYTVDSAVVSGSYSIFSVTPGLGGTWVIAGDHTDVFIPGVGPLHQFNISGPNPGYGTYTISSVVLNFGNTEVTVAGTETIPGTANTLGVATPTPAVTRITVTGVIPGTAAPDGTASSPPSVAYTFAFAPTMLTLIGPNTYTIIWHIVGTVASNFVVGCPLIIKDNSTFDNTTMTVLTAVDVFPNTEVTVQFRYPTFPVAPDATGTLTYPLPPIPFGFLQYDLTLAATSLELIGRGSPAFNNDITWGQAIQDNAIHLLENFNSLVPPAAPLQGQLWFNQGTSSLFLFTSTIYVIEAVDITLNAWKIDGSFDKNGVSLAAVDLTTIFTPGVKFVVYNNTGINLAGINPPVIVFQVLSSSNAGVGTDTQITIDTVPSSVPPFTVVANDIPDEACIDTPINCAAGFALSDGHLYAATEWNEVALAADLQSIDVKASVRLATTAALPAYTAAGAGFGKTLTANANGALSVDTTVVVAGNRILVKDQAVSHADHGIYVVTQVGDGGNPFILTRASDVDGAPGSEVSAGMFMWVNEGVTNNDTGWVLVTADPIVVDTTALQFTKFAIYAPGGADMTVQYNDGGVFGGDTDFTWNETTNTLAINGTISNAFGSAAAPSYTFTGNTNSGFYRSAADAVSVAIAGAEKVRFDAAGVTVFSSFLGTGGSAALPTYTFIGDTDTGVYSSGLDTVNITTAGVLRLSVAATGVTSTVPVVHPIGSAAAPSVTFVGDLNTGIYQSAVDEVAVTTAGGLRLTVSSGAVTSTVPLAMSANKITGVASGTVAGDALQFGQIGAQVQAFDSDLAALAATVSTGLYVVTGVGSSAVRTILGTAGEITLTNGSGVAGDPTVSIPTAVTFTGKTITGGLYVNPELKQYEETRSAPVIAATLLTLDIANGNHFAPISLDQNITAITISNVPAGTNAVVMTIVFTADGTLRTITWPASFKWSGGTAPTMTSTISKQDVIVATTYDNGVSWLATATQNF